MTKKQVTFYYKQGCHLCEDMWHHLLEMQQEHVFEIESVDITSDESLIEQYGTLIPVLTGDREPLCNYYLDPVALDEFLNS